MRKLILLLLSAIMLYNPVGAQFQNSILPETMIPNTNLGTVPHIHYATNYSIGDAEFSDFPSDLYVATWRNQYYHGQNETRFYYKRSEVNNPGNIIDEGHIAIQEALIRDAVIIQNPDYTKGNPGVPKYCVVVAYTKGLMKVGLTIMNGIW